jgi:site-specific DNA-methyltransferase (adenine-specific)
MKFDVVLGNPPYQNSHKKDNESKRKVGNKLWYQFIFKADELVKPNGYVAMVTPNQWLTGGVNMRKGELGVLKDVFAKKQLLIATVAGITEKYFKGIGISIGWWIYKNNPNTKPTILNLKDTTLSLDFNGLEFLSPVPDERSIGIITKTMLAQNTKFESYYFNSQAKPGINSETEKKTKENKYPHWIMGSTTTDNLVLRYFPKVMNTRVNYKKVVFPMSTRYWQPHLADSDISVTSLGQALKVPDDTTQDGFESVFYSKLFKYLCFNLQIAQNGFMKTVLVKSLPKLDMSKTWTDAKLYKHFNLTKDEIDYIESNVK